MPTGSLSHLFYLFVTLPSLVNAASVLLYLLCILFIILSFFGLNLYFCYFFSPFDLYKIGISIGGVRRCCEASLHVCMFKLAPLLAYDTRKPAFPPPTQRTTMHLGIVVIYTFASNLSSRVGQSVCGHLSCIIIV